MRGAVFYYVWGCVYFYNYKLGARFAHLQTHTTAGTEYLQTIHWSIGKTEAQRWLYVNFLSGF